jgi:hypothetical protein
LPIDWHSHFLSFLFFLRRTAKFQNSEYAGHQVGAKDSGSRNFSFLAFKGAHILRATATARDRRIFFAQIMFSAIKSHKTSKSANQYFYIELLRPRGHNPSNKTPAIVIPDYHSILFFLCRVIGITYHHFDLKRSFVKAPP